MMPATMVPKLGVRNLRVDPGESIGQRLVVAMPSIVRVDGRNVVIRLAADEARIGDFAAAREMKAHLQGKRIGVLVSGGNIDVERYCLLLNA